MMSFISIEFVLVFIIIFGLYYSVKKEYRYIVLTIASYGFYMLYGYQYMLLLLVITLVTYIGALAMQTKYKKISTYMIIGSITGILLYYKFGAYVIDRLGMVLPQNIFFAKNESSIIVPIGLSFYALQAIGYLADVYQDKIPAEKNFFKYSLFVSFFLTIVSGPIERTSNLLKQIQEGTEFSYEKAKTGLLRIVYGCFQKILIADRIGVLVEEAFSNYEGYTGAALVCAVILYGIQIYTDFAGYSNMAIGAGNLLGFDLMENFTQPYFACSIQKFWRRWHISLSSWLQDYIYIPLGGSRCGTIKMYGNLMITFLVSAIWHGNGLNYIIWGSLHGIYQIFGKATLQFRTKIKKELKINTECFSYHLFQILITFGLVDFAWLFFGASSASGALRMLQRMITEFQMGNTLSWKSYLFGMPEVRFILLILEILIVLIIDILHEKKISIRQWLNRQNKLFRWIIYVSVSLVVWIGIVYNYGKETSGFIYTRF